MNIIVSHAFFVLVLVIVFQFSIRYNTVTLYDSFTEQLLNALAGEMPDRTALEKATETANKVSVMISIVFVALALVTGFVVANITLRPTRNALSLQKKFISAIAHELRTPLAILRTTNEVALYDFKDNDPRREIVEENITQTKHLTRVLNNLLVFSRVDITESLPFTEVDITQAVNKVVERLEPFSSKKNISIKTTISEPLAIIANKTAVKQAIYNVLKNAVVYSNNNSEIIINVFKEPDNRVYIKICDKGIGIPRDKLPHIFEPFYRVSDDRTESGSMGLGLALVYEIIKLHAGSISVESVENKGTCFTLTFPITRAIKNTIKKHTQNDRVAFDFSQ